MPQSAPTKPWYQSKTIVSMIVTVLVVAYNEAVAVGFGLPQIPEFVYGVLAALGVYGRAVANTSLNLK